MPIKFTTMMGLPTAVSLFILVFHLSILSSVSKGVSAQIFLPPRVSTPQNTVMVKEGQTKVVLECQLDVGNDPVSYKWFKQYKWVTADLGFAYRTHRKVHLALHTVTRRHEGTYDCMATNEAGTDATTIEVIVVPGEHFHSSQPQDFPDTAIVLSELAASLNDVLAEGNCSCDLMFLLHASPDAHNDTLAAQANFVETIASTIISEEIHAGAATYSDYVNQKLPIGKGTSSCALQEALKDLGHKKWATRIQPVLRDSFKKLKKTKKECKVLFLFIFGSLGTEGANEIVAKHLKKIGVKLFILEVTNSPIKGVQEMRQRGEMGSHTIELVGCMAPPSDVDNVCGGEGTACTLSSQCRGVGFGCVEETCKSLECNVNPDNPECCKTPGDFWCGDVTKSCVSRELMCDGKIQCMNGRDEESCWQIACKEGEARCQSSTLCLTMYDLCDGLPHCPSAEDEDPSFCGSFPCPTDRPFRCRNGKCIPTERLCDGTFRDCADGEDEQLQYCSERHVCPSSRPFKCDYGVCVPERMVCDGSYNCLDALDERLCEERNCPPERPFKCSDGKCVDINLVCNGVVDACVDGADEKNCSAFVCPSERSFKCLNGRCIDKWLECDDRDDCGDGTDEMKCEKPAHTTTPLPVPSPIPTEITCQEGEFFCTSGVCLPEKKVCDGHRDCIDNEDEDVELCKDYSCPSYRAFKCWDHVCVDGKFCDGVEDCSSGADEAHCDDESEVETVIEGGESGETRDTGEIKEPEGGEGNEDPSTDLEDAMLVEESGCLSIVASPILLVLTAVLFVSV